MKRWLFALIAVLVLSSNVVTNQTGAQDDSSLKVSQDPAVGAFLTDAEGITLYLFTNDTTPGQSSCSGERAANWPPVPADTEVNLPPGIPGALTAIEREDGSMQLAYNDIPLYHFARDEKAGDANGQDVGDVWYIVPPGMNFGDPPHEPPRAR